jgi:hypothetical protein
MQMTSKLLHKQASQPASQPFTAFQTRQPKPKCNNDKAVFAKSEIQHKKDCKFTEEKGWGQQESINFFMTPSSLVLKKGDAKQTPNRKRLSLEHDPNQCCLV